MNAFAPFVALYTGELFWSWHDVIVRVLTLPPHQPLRVALRSPALHPASVDGFVRDFGMPAGPCGDWRLPLADGSCLHAQDTCDRALDVHWDVVDPTPSLGARVRHALVDAPELVILAGAALGALADESRKPVGRPGGRRRRKSSGRRKPSGAETGALVAAGLALAWTVGELIARA